MKSGRGGGAGENGSRGARGEEQMSRRPIQSDQELQVYQLAFEAAMRMFELTEGFPKEELYSLVDQMGRSSRSVCANIAEAWRKRRYEAAFVSRLNDAESEAAESQTWIEFSMKCGYLRNEIGHKLSQT